MCLKPLERLHRIAADYKKSANCVDATITSLCESRKKKPQISPLRYAPVEICGFFFRLSHIL